MSINDHLDQEVVRSEICVIGSGPAGGIPAAALAEFGFDVVVVEAGPATGGDGPGLFTESIRSSGSVDLPPSGTTQLGGSSNLWAGRLAELEPFDFACRDWIPDSGWPLTAADLPYERAFRLLMESVPTGTAEPAPPAFAPALAAGTLDVKKFYWGPKPFNVAQHLRSAAGSARSRLRVFLNSPVVELVEAEGGGRIAAATIRRPDGTIAEVRSDVFILAAGGLESARILLSSRSRGGSAIGNGEDLVGRYLSTHPKADLATLVLSRRAPTGHPLFADRTSGSSRVRFGLGLTETAQRREKLLNHYIQLSPFLEYRANRLFEMARASKAIKSPFIDESRLARGILPSIGLFVFENIGRLAGIQTSAKSFILRGFLDQFPDPSNRVQLSGSCNKFGLPTVNVSWSYTERDRDSVVRFLSVLDNQLRTHKIGVVNYDILARHSSEWPLTGIHSHFMGTTRMAETAKQGVVDRNCRVFGQENLYVNGPSVFPGYGFANPFMTIAALSFRLVDHLSSVGARQGRH